jgi:hypothetical protein
MKVNLTLKLVRENNPYNPQVSCQKATSHPDHIVRNLSQKLSFENEAKYEKPVSASMKSKTRNKHREEGVNPEWV